MTNNETESDEMAMKEKKYKIFVINPGSTSTKISLFENMECLFTTSIFHDSSVLRSFASINDQLGYRMELIWKFLEEKGIDLTGIDAVVGRGGGAYSVVSGTYLVDELLLADNKAIKSGVQHASVLGIQMAQEVHKRYGGTMFMVDPPMVDEFCDLARVSGVDGIYRKARNHVLNLKAAGRIHAESMGRRYEECNFVICHIDGGISITAHEKGRMIDGNDASGGEGPFTPTRMGSLSLVDVLEYLKEGTVEELRGLCSQTGGFSSYFGTSNSDIVHKMVEEGDPKAVRVWNAMIYQIAKWIGSMSAVLKGKVDGIILTGGLVRFEDVVKGIEEHCGWIAPVAAYPGEFEQERMAEGALQVLRGEEEAKRYPGKPVWSGFSDPIK